MSDALTMPELKRCAICKDEKPLVDFGVHNGKKASPDGRQGYRKPCGRLDSQLRWHNMTLEQYYQMLCAQQGKCLICDEYMLKPEIDHDHRCLLCRDCNRTLGWARDNPERLLTAAAYLVSHSGGDEAQCHGS